MDLHLVLKSGIFFWQKVKNKRCLLNRLLDKTPIYKEQLILYIIMQRILFDRNEKVMF